MKKTPNGLFCLSAFALSFAALFTACQSTPPRTAAKLKSLQGYWEGEGSGGKCSMTITGNSLHWDSGYQATFTLPASTGPQQLRATIKDSPDKTTNTIGKVVVAIFKIEDGTLTLALNQDTEGPPPNAFPSDRDGPLACYYLKKVQPQKKNTEPPKPNEPKTP